jgi:hypothetical protein
VHVPAGAVHACTGSGLRRILPVSYPDDVTTPGHGEFYRAISIPARADGLPTAYDVDWDRINATAADFGIEVHGDLPDE